MKAGLVITISTGRRLLGRLRCACRLHDRQYAPVFEQAPDGALTAIVHRYVCYRCGRAIGEHRQEFQTGRAA